MQDQSSQVFPSGNLPCKTDSLDYVVARIAHIKESTLYHHEKPYMILSAGDVKIPKTNCFFTAGNNVIIRDLRASGPGLRDANDFDSQGFAYLSNVPSAVNPSMDKFKSSDMPAELLEYLEETRMFVNGYFKADKTICFDWRVRFFLSLFLLLIRPISIFVTQIKKQKQFIVSIIWFSFSTASYKLRQQR